MKKKKDHIQYFLSSNDYELSIASYQTDKPNEKPRCILTVYDMQIDQSDDYPLDNLDGYIKIEAKDYYHVCSIFDKAVQEMNLIGEKAAQPRNRPFAKGDYLNMGGQYLHIVDIPEPSQEYWGACFFGDEYEIDIDTECDWLTGCDGIFSCDKEDFDYYRLISKETYEEAYNVAKTAIREATDYLEALYKRLTNK